MEQVVDEGSDTPASQITQYREVGASSRIRNSGDPPLAKKNETVAAAKSTAPSK
ncbi:MAG: hypothetical protein WD273_03085 [Trueperaceae bacterium]